MVTRNQKAPGKRPTPNVQRPTSNARVVDARPILMSAAMVRATLEGRKTKTRRVILPQPQTAQMISPSTASLTYPGMLWRESPYGQPGDQLWVREAWAAPTCYDDEKPRDLPDTLAEDDQIIYRASSPDYRVKELGSFWRPSIHMPRWASRITLQIAKVRVERLQEITGPDVVAEGVTYPVKRSETVPGKCAVLWDISSEFSPLNYIAEKDRGNHEAILIAHYAALWDSLNAKRKDPAGKVGAYAWAKNPFVWVIEFRYELPTLIPKSPASCVLADRVGGVRNPPSRKATARQGAKR